MKPQREIRGEDESTEGNLLARTALEKDLSPLGVLFFDLGVALWFHGSFEKREQFHL